MIFSRLGTKCLNSRSLIALPRRTKMILHRDWMPSTKQPKTKAEIAATAEKYGMLPEDYKPTDPSCGFGSDYPNVPLQAVGSRNPYYNWDDSVAMRDYCEPLNINMDIYTGTRMDPNSPSTSSHSEVLQISVTVVGLIVLFSLEYYFSGRKLFMPVMPKQMPNSGGKHYTFELE